MTLSHDVAGQGPAVVLLHSSVCDRRMWEPQWAALVDAGYRVVRCDFRGFGGTPMPDGPYAEHEDVADLLDGLGIERAAVVGSSYGGRIALNLAALRPERVAALALLCPAVPGHEPSAKLREFGAREDELLEAGDVAGAVELNLETWLGPEADGATRELVRTMQRHSFDVQLAGPQDVGPTRPEVDLAHVQAPALVVGGAFDHPDFVEIARELPGRLGGGSRSVLLDWAGHLPSLERPAEVTELLLAYLAEAHPAR
ncbi:alpha/beta hydrolase [Kitasatospora terrestris]